MYHEGILVLDLGGPEARSVARKLRGEHVYSEILGHGQPIAQDVTIKGVILAGGAGDAFAEGAILLHPGVLALGLPVLGLGYGGRALLRALGAARTGGHPLDQAVELSFADVPLFQGMSSGERLMEREDEYSLPEGVNEIASTREGRGVGFVGGEGTLFSLPFYPEANDPDGLRLLRNFALMICGAQAEWTIETFLAQSIAEIQASVGQGRALIAISGGVDSSVCAALMHRALGDALTCLHVDTGLMRKGEREQVEQFFAGQGMRLTVIDARDRFLEKLRGVTGNEAKRQAVDAEYERVMRETCEDMQPADYMAEGTIYNDLLDGVVAHGALGCARQERMLAPIHMLFKEEVRDMGQELGLPEELVNRQAFPSAGLAVRCVGEVTSVKLAMVGDADQIFREEISKAGLDKRIRQYFAVLTDIRTEGAGDAGHTLALRAVNPGPGSRATVYRLPYDLLERVVERITSEVPGVNRVVYDVTGQPPAAIEWD